MSDIVIEFPATVVKVQTLSDYGIRVTLDLPETAIPQMAQLVECKRQNIALTIVCKPDLTNILPENTDDLPKRTRSKPRF